MSRLETTLLLSIGGGDAEAEFARLVVEYTFTKGYRATFHEPGCADTVEIGRVYVAEGDAAHPLPEWMVERLNDQLERLCLDYHRGRDTYAREIAAEMRREEAPAHITRAAE